LGSGAVLARFGDGDLDLLLELELDLLASFPGLLLWTNWHIGFKLFHKI